MIYEVEIKETMSRVIYVAAGSEREALAKADGLYTSGEVVLGASDFVDYDISLADDEC